MEVLVKEGWIFILEAFKYTCSYFAMLRIAQSNISLSAGEATYDDQSFTLSQGNRQHSFMVDISDNDDIEMSANRERQLTLNIQIISFDSDLYTLDQGQLTVVIKDNDTGE